MYPEKFIQRIKGQLREETDLFFESLSKEERPSIRINPLKLPLQQELEQVAWCKNAYYLDKRPVFTLDPRFHAGAYYVQEASSMFLQQAWKKISGELTEPRVLDLCAAPGGKSTLLASELAGTGFLVSNEVIQSRAQVLRENMIKWGSSHVLVTNNDPRDFSKLRAAFDVVVIDAPCSGEGLFRKDKNACSEWSEDHVELCGSRQKRILSDVLPALRKGGYLVYSTCTFSETENEDMIRWLCSSGKWQGIDLEPVKSWGVTTTGDPEFPSYRFYPHKTRGEGFFMCVLKKLDGDDYVPAKAKNRFLKEADKKSQDLVSGLLPGKRFYFTHKEELRAIPPEHAVWADEICKSLRNVKLGTGLGEVAGKDFRPSHELAMYSELPKDIYPTYECSLEEALRYLKKEDIRLSNQPSGWLLLRFEGINLGFVKNLGNRCNNYYPKEWRILMSLPKETGSLPF